jgi:eukaryotic-like serine/threonine-protein kinase
MSDLTERLQRALGTTYRLERELPGGGMSRVFLATEVHLAREVVVKVLPPEMAAAVQSERFAREIQVAASLQHPHIVPLLTAGSAEGLAWYVMPFIAGESLAARLNREGALPVNEVLRILRDVTDALAYSHGRGVVHRDIKPDNIMLSGRHALVTDFGVAKAVSASSGGRGALTTGGVALGTPTYMAPEQAAADPHVDHRADLYALGVVAYELLTGRTPFVAPTPQAMLAAHVTAYPDQITLHRPSLPPMLAAAVMRCLEKHPADRWQTSAELAAVIESVATPSGGLTPVPTTANPSIQAYSDAALRKANPFRVAALFALATAVVVAVVYGATRVFGLPDWVWIGSAGLMAIGFPIVMYTGRVERKRARAAATGQLRFVAPPPHHELFTWRRAILGGAIAIGALLFAAVGYAAARTLGIGPAGTLLSSGVVGAEDRFVLADFTNRTSDSGLGTSVTEALRVDLGQSRVVRIFSDREVAGALTRMTLRSGTPLSDSLALELGRREGAKAVIAGDVATLGTGYVLTGRVLETATGETRAAVRATAVDAAHLLSALNDLSGQLRERIGESLRSIRASEPLEQVTTGSLAALQEYSLGARVFVAGDYEGAKRHLEAAIAADSNFAMAYRKLGAVYTNLAAPRSQITAVSRKAFELRDRLTPVERYLTEAAYYRNVEPDPERVIAAYQAVLAINPYDITAANNISMAFFVRDRNAEAEATLRPVIARTPTRTLYVNLAGSLAALGKWDVIDSFARDANERLDPPADVPNAMMATRFGSAREWWRADSMLRAIGPAPSRAEEQNRRFFLMDVRTALGQHQTALAVIDAMAVQLAAAGDSGTALDLHSSRAWESLLFDGDSALARRQMVEALRRFPLDRIPPADRPFANLGGFYARLGDVEMVRRYQREFEAAIPASERGPAERDRWIGFDAWARRDYAAAAAAQQRIRQINSCAHCRLYEEAELWAAAGNADSALSVLERAVTLIAARDVTEDALSYGPALNRLGEMYEAKRDRAKAREYYQRFVDLWRAADPVFQPRVAEAKRRLTVLGADAALRP